MKLLSHHVRAIKTTCQPQFSPEKWANAQVWLLQQKKITDGQPVYPGLDTPEGFARSVLIRVSAVLAVRSGDFTEVPDFTPSGEQNFDALCFACGNFRPGQSNCRYQGKILEFRTKR